MPFLTAPSQQLPGILFPGVTRLMLRSFWGVGLPCSTGAVWGGTLRGCLLKLLCQTSRKWVCFVASHGLELAMYAGERQCCVLEHTHQHQILRPRCCSQSGSSKEELYRLSFISSYPSLLPTLYGQNNTLFSLSTLLEGAELF